MRSETFSEIRAPGSSAGRRTGAGADSGNRHCEGERVREGRQGPGSRRGALHRGNETGRERHAPTRRRRVHAVRRVRRFRFASRLRAASSSSGVNAPCLASHLATPASPSRTTRARRAASVIHAETLIPSAAAASTMPACTSGSPGRFLRLKQKIFRLSICRTPGDGGSVGSLGMGPARFGDNFRGHGSRVVRTDDGRRR
jgi:hypothetical protein